MYYSYDDLSEDKNRPYSLICYKGYPLFEPNEFICNAGKNSIKTKDDYAQVLVGFFNYFEDKFNICDYRKISRLSSINDYMDFKINYKKNSKTGRFIRNDDETNITARTANKYLLIISSFYFELDRSILKNMLIDEDFVNRALKGQSKKHKPSYKGIWKVTDLSFLACTRKIVNWKSPRKVKKILKNNEISWIVDNLPFRDKCIFLLCLETGCRISECLYIKLKYFTDYQDGSSTVFIDKSKTNERMVNIPKYLTQLIKKYILTERCQTVSNNDLKKVFLFVSKKGKNKGDRVTYQSYRKCLKKAALDAGIDDNQICTHLCRSTKLTAMDVQGYSLEQILRQSGNNTIGSLDNYIFQNTREQAISFIENMYTIDDTNRGKDDL